MNVDDLIDYYGAKHDKELGKKLKISKISISKWRNRGIPQERQAVFQCLTNNKLKADLTDYDSNPET